MFIEEVLQVAGPVFFIGLQISALNTARAIYLAKNVGGLSPLPFISLLVNCIVWSIYGSLKSDMTVLIPNLSGLVVGSVCSFIYQKYSSTNHDVTSLVGVLAVILAIYFWSNDDVGNVGILGCVLAVIVMGSPLATLKLVLSDRSTSSLPFWTCLSGFLNSLSWLLYGVVVANDPMIYVPNFLGFLLASTQIALFIIFGFPPQSKILV